MNLRQEHLNGESKPLTKLPPPIKINDHPRRKIKVKRRKAQPTPRRITAQLARPSFFQQIREYIQRITEFYTTQADVVSRHVRSFTRRFVGLWRQPVDDWGRSDYAYWRRAYRANVKGLELSGLFIKPVIHKIAAWSLTPPPEWRCENALSQERINDWFGLWRGTIKDWVIAGMKVGDSFLVINPDLSATIVAAEFVDPIVSEDDYSLRVGWKITRTLEHPQETKRMVIVDEYYADRRVHRVEVDGNPFSERVFPNLIGIIPVIHLANNVDEGQTFGYAEASTALNLLFRYNDVLLAGIEGNILQGRPTPVAKFATEQDLEKFWELYGDTDETTMPDGSVVREPVIDIDLSELITLSGGDFNYAQPGRFIEDTEKLLGLAFYLLLEHWEMPEFVFGNAISSSQASAQTQMPVWENYIGGRQDSLTPPLIEVATVVNAFQSLIEPGVAQETPSVQFAKLTQDGKLILEVLKWLLLEGLIDDRTALVLAPANVENVDAVLEQARKERAERDQKALAQAEAVNPRSFNDDRDREIERLETESEG